MNKFLKVKRGFSKTRGRGRVRGPSASRGLSFL